MVEVYVRRKSRSCVHQILLRKFKHLVYLESVQRRRRRRRALGNNTGGVPPHTCVDVVSVFELVAMSECECACEVYTLFE